MLAASPNSGVNTLTGEGLSEALAGAQVVVDVLRSTQFFEFIGRIAEAGMSDNTVRVSSAMFQPVLSDNVVEVLADLAVGSPVNGTVEVGGPERGRMVDFVEHVMRANGDARNVIGDPHALYFGAELDDQSLVAGPSARIGSKPFAVWLTDSLAARSH